MFSVKEAVCYGWRVFRAHTRFFLLLAATYFFIVFSITFIGDFVYYFYKHLLPPFSWLALVVFKIVGFYVDTILFLGVIYLILHTDDKKKPFLKDIVRGYPFFLKYLFSAFIYWVIVSVGLLLFVVPGIIWALKYQFYAVILVDQGKSAKAAIKESARITQGAKGKLFLFAITAVLVNIVGVLCCFVGLLVSIPVTGIAYIYIYKILKARFNSGYDEPIME